MEIFSMLLALCEGGRPVTGGTVFKCFTLFRWEAACDHFCDGFIMKYSICRRPSNACGPNRVHLPQPFQYRHKTIKNLYRWLSVILYYLQCVSNVDTAVLHQAINMLWVDGPSSVGTTEYHKCNVLKVLCPYTNWKTIIRVHYYFA